MYTNELRAIFSEPSSDANTGTGENSGPTKMSGFMGIPVLRGSGLEGFYCTIVLYERSNNKERLIHK